MHKWLIISLQVFLYLKNRLTSLKYHKTCIICNFYQPVESMFDVIWHLRFRPIRGAHLEHAAKYGIGQWQSVLLCIVTCCWLPTKLNNRKFLMKTMLVMDTNLWNCEGLTCFTCLATDFYLYPGVWALGTSWSALRLGARGDVATNALLGKRRKVHLTAVK